MISKAIAGSRKLSSKRVICSNIALKPKNAKQAYYLDILKRDTPHVVIASGVAGSGKTLLATIIGIEKLLNGSVRKLVVTRPTVPVGDDIGYLPGTLNKKMEPWIRPIYDSLSMHYSSNKIENMFKENIIEVVPLTYMRGRTFSDSWIICDEAQNLTIDQSLMVLTRIGQNSKMVITGDPMQHDRKFGDNGLIDLMNKVSMSYHEPNPYFEVVEFTEDDVERHPIIPHVVKMYKTS
jgi:phosphate starvation-inducible protein PhoH and related proteins